MGHDIGDDWSLSSDDFHLESFDYGVRIPMTHFELADEAKGQRFVSEQESEEVTSKVATERATVSLEASTSCAPGTRQNHIRLQRQKDNKNFESFSVRGKHCTVHKHMRIGCAVVSFESEAERAMMFAHVKHKNSGSHETNVLVGNHVVQVKEHFDKRSGSYDSKCLFLSWGYKYEKRSPLAAEELAECVDAILADEFEGSIRV
eukprot:TRINITY_DN67007_c0_g1_i1.p1 TRINITY_DN67007_c0_g1~~TRINITY_DN67007_c0_g1_i1.p1  ORF type:complete len:220 (+),score=29.31 TRINITY_DN67007_c0_g1_i1:49-660(+)